MMKKYVVVVMMCMSALMVGCNTAIDQLPGFDSPVEKAAAAINAGNDVDFPVGANYQYLQQAIDQDMVSPEVLERAVKAVAQHGGTLMRPLVFDYAHDAEALKQSCQYMFGPALLISPVTQPGVTKWRTYLPQQPGGWYDYRAGRHYKGGQYVTTPVTKAYIPVFVRAGYQQLISNTSK